MIIKVPDVYRPLYTTQKPIILLTGGRGSAKSFNLNLWLKRLTYEAGHKALLTRYTMTSAEKSVIPELIQKMELEGDSHNFEINAKGVVNKFSGSSILFSGIKTSSGNQTANLKSIEGLTTFVMDEGEEWQSETEFDTIRLSIRKKGIQNRTVIAMNTTNKDHFVYDRFIKDTCKHVDFEGVPIQISTHPMVEHIHTTYLNNLPHLSDTFIQDVTYIKQTNKDKYNHIILGQWRDKAEGVILTNWVKWDEFPKELPVLFGLDWGFKDQFTLTKYAFDDTSIYAENLVYLSGLGTDDIKRIVATHVKDEIIIADSANATGIFDLRSWGFNVFPANKKVPIAYTLQQLQDFQIRVINSPHMEYELNNYAWLDKRGEYPMDAHNHIIDTLRYTYLHHKRNFF
ncbi:MAG TPA: phage terminase large subunit [Luteibaculaceae bacterium]|nr:phage terminase large subunit [Luteibaculaceae bacterium]